MIKSKYQIAHDKLCKKLHWRATVWKVYANKARVSACLAAFSALDAEFSARYAVI